MGKMGFYLSAVDELLRHPEDGNSIGLILCKTKKTLIAEDTVRTSHSPIGISEYRLAEPLPTELGGSLPSIENIEKELKP